MSPVDIITLRVMPGSCLRRGGRRRLAGLRRGRRRLGRGHVGLGGRCGLGGRGLVAAAADGRAADAAAAGGAAEVLLARRWLRLLRRGGGHEAGWRLALLLQNQFAISEEI